jgi:hypothetical protein
LKIFDFNISKWIGKVATKAIEEYYIGNPVYAYGIPNSGWSIINVEEDPLYQKDDIDLLMVNPYGTSLAEVKGDLYPNNNIFLETWSCMETNSRGWIYKTKADTVIYYFMLHKIVYLLPFPQVTEWFDAHKEQLINYRKVVKNKGRRGIYTSEGYAIPIGEIVQGVNQYCNRNVICIRDIRGWTKEEIQKEAEIIKHEMDRPKEPST